MAEDVVAIYRLKFKDLASKGLIRVQSVANGMNRALKSGAKVVGALGVASVAAAAKMATLFADRADEINKFSKQVDISAVSLQRLEFIANRQGASFDKVKSGIEKFTKSMGEFRAGTGSLKTVLDKVDPALGKQLLSIKDNSEAVNFAVAALSKYKDTQKQAAVAGALFGRSGGASFVRIVEGGAEALAQLNKDAAKFRPPIDKKTLKLGEDYKDSLFNTQQVIASIGDKIGQRLLPLMISTLDKFNEFIATNRALINSKVDMFFKRVGDFVKGIDFRTLAQRGGEYLSVARDIATRTGEIIDKFGGLKNIAKAVLAVFVVANIVTFAAKLATLVSVLGGPVTLAIMGVVAAGALIYRNWDKIKAKAAEMGIDLDAVFASLGRAASTFAATIQIVMTGLSIGVDTLVHRFKVAKAVITSVWSSIAANITAKVAAIMSAIETVTSKLSAMGQFASLATPQGRAVGAAVNAVRSRVASPNVSTGRQEVDVKVTLDGKVQGAEVKANVTTSSGRNRGGSNMPRGRKTQGAF